LNFSNVHVTVTIKERYENFISIFDALEILWCGRQRSARKAVFMTVSSQHRWKLHAVNSRHWCRRHRGVAVSSRCHCRWRCCCCCRNANGLPVSSGLHYQCNQIANGNIRCVVWHLNRTVMQLTYTHGRTLVTEKWPLLHHAVTTLGDYLSLKFEVLNWSRISFKPMVQCCN